MPPTRPRPTLSRSGGSCYDEPMVVGPPPRDRLVALIFRVWSGFYDQPLLQEPLYRRVHARLLSLLDPLPEPNRALDLGCGTAQLTADLVARYPGAAVVGADLSGDMLAVAAQRAVALGFERVNANVYALPFAAGSFDLVTNTISYHWYLDYQRALAEIRRVLRPGGHFVVATISSPILRSRMVRRSWELLTVDRTRMVVPGQIERELDVAGFEVVTTAPVFPCVRVFVAHNTRRKSA